MSILDTMFILITYLGDELFIFISLPFIYLFRKKFGLRLAVAVLVTIYFASLLKMILRIPRPDPSNWKIEVSGYSFPSGHAADSAAFWGFIGISYKDNKYVLALTTIIFTLVGFSRIYLGVHWWFDVVGGWILGLVIAILTYFYSSYVEKKVQEFDIKIKISVSLILFLLMVLLGYPFSYGDLDDFYNLIKVSSVLLGIFIGLTLGEKIYEKWEDGETLKQFILRGLIGLLIIVTPFIIYKAFETLVIIFVSFTLIGLLLTLVPPIIIQKIGLNLISFLLFFVYSFPFIFFLT